VAELWEVLAPPLRRILIPLAAGGGRPTVAGVSICGAPSAIPHVHALASAAGCRRSSAFLLGIEGIACEGRHTHDLGDGACAVVIGPLGGGKHNSLVVRVFDLDRVTAAPGPV
jgi:hypothetical protein